jgi:hypothetical protein
MRRREWRDGCWAGVVIFVLLIGAPYAAAQSYIALGVGADSCGRWVADRRARNYDMVIKEGWVTGYLSGYNRWSPRSAPDRDISGGTDAAGLFAWIDNYCAAHPLMPLAGAAESLVFTLRQ